MIIFTSKYNNYVNNSYYILIYISTGVERDIKFAYCFQALKDYYPSLQLTLTKQTLLRVMIIAVLKTFVFLFTYPGVFLLSYFANHLVDSGLKSTLQLISDINLNILILFDSFACEWINVRASFCFLFAFSNFF